MKKITKFLDSKFYIFGVFAFTLITWSIYHDTPPYQFNIFNMIGVFSLIFLIALLMIFFNDTKYTIPPFLSLFFVVNKADLTFDTTTVVVPIIVMALLIISFVTHMIIYKFKLSKKTFFYGFLLIAISYIIPLIYTPFLSAGLAPSLIGLTYVFVYVFFANTQKADFKYYFTILMAINLLLVMQVFIYIYRGFFIWTDLPFFERLFLGWLRNLGWANINDVTFYITLTFPSYLYFIFKQPRKIYWFFMLCAIIAVVLTKSRGGYMGFGIVLILSIILIIKHSPKSNLKYLYILFGLPLLSVLLNPGIIIAIWNDFRTSFGSGFDFFTGNRIYIYTEGLKIFLRYPIFGGGWLSIQTFPFDGRIFMFHSTIIQVLAAMGLFGLIALVIHYIQITKFIKRNYSFEVILFMIGYLATQIHGLIENVQFSVPYSILIAVILSVYETNEHKTEFELSSINHYALIERKDC
jgi:O-antigen ligase